MTRTRTVALEAAVSAAISLVLALLVMGPVLPLLGHGWFGADMLAQYVTTQSWSVVSFAPTTQFGYPAGLDYNYFPNGDGLENALTHLLALTTGSTFAGVNLLILLSFPVAGALALLLVRLTRLSGPLAVAFAVAIAMLPFHWVRALQHTYLSTTVSLLTGLILVLLVASGRLVPLVARSRGGRRWGVLLGLAALVAVTAWSGVYYATFTIILSVSALVLRFAKGDRWRAIGLAALPTVAIAVLMAVGQLPMVLARDGAASIGPVAERSPIESFHFAGSLVAALIPGPLSAFPAYTQWLNGVFADAPPFENTLASNFGTVVTTGALVLFVVALILRSRRGQPVSPADSSGVTPGVIAWLLGTALLFFVPWGLNFAFAVLVTPQIRSWNRLLPALLILFLLGAATILRDAAWLRAGRSAFLAGCLVVLIVALDVVVPSAGAFTATVRLYSESTDRARAYADELNAAVPGECAVLQVPFGTYPEPDFPYGDRSGYEHLWQSLTNDQKRWSYGAIKNTTASAWQQQIVGAPTDEQIALLEEAGFCAIHLDMGAAPPDEVAAMERDLTARLGAPVAQNDTDGWQAWRLPDAQPIRPPAQWPAQVQEFFGLTG